MRVTPRRRPGGLLAVAVVTVLALLGGLGATLASAYVAPHGLELSGTWAVNGSVLSPTESWVFTAQPEWGPLDTAVGLPGSVLATIQPTVSGNQLTVVETFNNVEYPGRIETFHGTLFMGEQGEPAARGTWESNQPVPGLPEHNDWVGHDIYPAETSTAPSGGGLPVLVKCAVPHLKGKTVAAAGKAISKAHCTLGKVKRVRSRHVRKGLVIAQSQPAGRSLAKGTKVNLVVSSG